MSFILYHRPSGIEYPHIRGATREDCLSEAMAEAQCFGATEKRIHVRGVGNCSLDEFYMKEIIGPNQSQNTA